VINLTGLLGGTLGQAVKDIVGSFKLDPAKKAELESLVDQNAAILAQKQLELEGKLQDAITSEVQASADIIKAEAQSQSWLPRNVRPLLLLMWGVAITFNVFLPLISRAVGSPVEALTLDPWVYKLTAIGFTGYVGARSLEKVWGVTTK
jgi:hypothetical protein